MAFPPLPERSRLSLADTPGAAEIRWRAPGAWRRRVLPALVLGGWLAGWGLGAAALVGTLLDAPGVAPAVALVAWSLAGLLVLALFAGFVLPARRARLTLDGVSLRFRPGTPPSPGPGRWRQVVAPPEPVAVERRTVRSVADTGTAVRIEAQPPLEIGRELPGPDRAWLAALLRGWAHA